MAASSSSSTINIYDTDARSIGHGCNYPCIRVGYFENTPEGKKFTEKSLDSYCPYDLVHLIRPSYVVIKTCETLAWSTHDYPKKADVKYELISKKNDSFKGFVDPYYSHICELLKMGRGQFLLTGINMDEKEKLFPYDRQVVGVYASGAYATFGYPKAVIFPLNSKLMTTKSVDEREKMGVYDFLLTVKGKTPWLENRVNPTCFDHIGMF